jgi:hypothetical protein
MVLTGLPIDLPKQKNVMRKGVLKKTFLQTAKSADIGL